MLLYLETIITLKGEVMYKDLIHESANLITAPDAAKMIGTSVNYINSLVKNKKLMPKRILPTNGKRLFSITDINSYILTMQTI